MVLSFNGSTPFKLTTQMRLVRFFARLFIKLLSFEGGYLRSKLLHHVLVVGPAERLHLGDRLDLQDAVLNVNSGHIFIGDDSFCGAGVMILTGKHDVSKRGRDRQQDHPREGNDIKIGKGVWLSSRVTVCGPCVIVDDVVVAAGAVVVSDLLSPGIYGGVPARFLKPL